MSRRSDSYLLGLSPEQRIKVLANLPEPLEGRAGGDGRRGWWLYREPTTINPPTTLRLHRRDDAGSLRQVVSITENGVTK